MKFKPSEAAPFVSVVIPAAGKGRRMGTKINKQFLKLKGAPVLYWTIRAFDRCAAVDEIVVVLHPDEQGVFDREILSPYTFSHPIKTVSGGATRSASVYNGLRQVDPKCGVVLIHDGARPLVQNQLILDCIDSAVRHRAAIAAVPAKNTIKSVKPIPDAPGELAVDRTLDRSALYEIQTPQAFDYALILEAYQWAQEKHLEATDDAALVEGMGQSVAIVPGTYQNIKITTAEDLKVVDGLTSFLTHEPVE
ncbi:MAG: 2-C-methyl-D-erythritol 4-phosphate cytidylyltransferase [Pseudoramibacter sp.]